MCAPYNARMSTTALSACCAAEAARSLARARDVATCDRCGRLLLAWEDPAEQEKTRAELVRHGVAFAEGRVGKLWVTAKPRR